MTKKIVMRCLLVMILALSFIDRPLAQNALGAVIVSGSVSDQGGEAIAGASVQVSGTGVWALTDTDGCYSIQAARGSVLIFSFLGMETVQVTVGDSPVVNVVMKTEASFLDEAVAIGYGTQSRTLVTNSISKVGAEEFIRTPSQNALSQLQGKVPGLTLQISNGQPGSTPQVFIRGGSSTSPESDTPLIIVDGVISQGFRSLQDMNPADIESP